MFRKYLYILEYFLSIHKSTQLERGCERKKHEQLRYSHDFNLYSLQTIPLKIKTCN